ncbi:hypothetical protein F7R91_14625 [Streptomyces luteolifulvus]|uniref:Uncharacterized protein n=1 Tax=Streptomyces luteolifulvus TaxID=2615112 RepID=A0A6H9V1E8_9ACTN|nr:hypothetical protein [Streptomyces luteolifulvus]KAB1146809.1 hypothetical protein F7R91_14625 [Streptomyces luteolifulvus]
MTLQTIEHVTGRSLVGPAFFERLSRRVAKTNGMTPETADAITDQALAYLATSAQKPDGAPTLYMSADVDPAWHEFMTFTAAYDQFFRRPGWHKVHHAPCDGWGGATYPAPHVAIPPTVDAIRAAGYQVVPELWTAKVDCGDTCGDDGKPGDPLPCGDHG